MAVELLASASANTTLQAVHVRWRAAVLTALLVGTGQKIKKKRIRQLLTPQRGPDKAADLLEGRVEDRKSGNAGWFLLSNICIVRIEITA